MRFPVRRRTGSGRTRPGGVSCTPPIPAGASRVGAWAPPGRAEARTGTPPSSHPYRQDSRDGTAFQEPGRPVSAVRLYPGNPVLPSVHTRSSCLCLSWDLWLSVCWRGPVSSIEEVVWSCSCQLSFLPYPLPVISKAKVCDSTNVWPTILRKRLTNSLLDFDNGRHCSGMDVSEVPSFGRNRMVADNAPENS